MTSPAKLKFTIYQGATFRKRLTWQQYPYPTEVRGGVTYNKTTGAPASLGDLQPIDLTGCTARIQVRPDIESATVLVELNTTNGGITLGGVVGTVDLYLTDEATADFAWTSGVWDLEITHPGGEVTRLAYGTVSVSPEVTRD